MYKWGQVWGEIQIPVTLEDPAKQAYRIFSSLSAKPIQHLHEFRVLRSLQLKTNNILIISKFWTEALLLEVLKKKGTALYVKLITVIFFPAVRKCNNISQAVRR